jgi:hypothetical protein
MSLNIWQVEIENDEVGRLAHELESRLTVAGFDDVITLGDHPHAQKLTDRRLVVDDQHFDRSCRHATEPNSRELADIGSLIVNTAPEQSARFAAMIVPFKASTKPRDIASPSPVPARTQSPFCTR